MTTQNVGDVQLRRNRDYGEILLKQFHDSYAQDPTSRDTEYRRGLFSGWKGSMISLFGEAEGEEIILGVGEKLGLTVPHSGPMTEDGSGYIGWDSYCHMGPIGKLISN